MFELRQEFRSPGGFPLEAEWYTSGGAGIPGPLERVELLTDQKTLVLTFRGLRDGRRYERVAVLQDAPLIEKR